MTRNGVLSVLLLLSAFAGFAFAGKRPLPAARQTPAATYTRDIAPIVFAKCGVCHRPGGSAPFSLISYDTARQHASQMATVTASGFMPPWKAEAGPGQAFIGQPHLTDAEIARIAEWARTGAAEGNPADLPPAPHWTEGWQLGKPDVIVRPPAYTLQAEGTDVFRIFVVPLPVDQVKFVRGLEFRPGNPRVVHHANIRIDPTPRSREFDDADPLPGYEGLIAHSAVYPDGHFLGWTPGQVAPLLPKGLAWRLQPHTDLVVEIHMQPSGKSEVVQPSIGLYFGADPPERTPAMLRLGRQNIDIAAGDSNYVITDSFVLPVDAEVQAVQPHAHYRARDVRGTATLPDGTVRPLIHIKDWDFRWQHVYRYVTPFWLPKGTTLSMRYTYDNSADNPRNPNRPPRHVYWGQRSADEMGDLWIQVLTRTDQDLEVLNDAFRPKVIAEDVIGYERWIQSEPESVALHDDVAMLYLDLNRPADAVRHFAISAKLAPDSAAAHFNLGTALTVAGRTEEATAEYRRALELKPDYAQAHNNLASILLNAGRTDEAMAHLLQALTLDPKNPQAHYNVAAAYAILGDFDRAVREAQQAVALAPENAALRDALERFKRRQR
jgi:Flp pilus assembly protein TadD/mono/diheme cytochrome c family protein